MILESALVEESGIRKGIGSLCLAGLLPPSSQSWDPCGSPDTGILRSVASGWSVSLEQRPLVSSGGTEGMT